MIQGYKVVALMPAGRKKYMRHTLKNLLTQGDCLDEIRIWENTSNASDLQFIKKCEQNINKVSVVRVSSKVRDHVFGFGE